MNNKTYENKIIAKPVTFLIAKQVEDPKTNGGYCTRIDTWSNRNYELVVSKKHCEAM
jgi:hypothetical protein